LSASTLHERAEQPVLPFTRKYLGSKRQLREWIAGFILERAGRPGTFLDGFFGTAAVSFALAESGAGSITAVDSLRSNCVILRGFLASSPRVDALRGRLNSLLPRPGYITESYAGTYFTEENCGLMDAVREEIERLHAEAEISVAEHDVLLSSFLLAADRVANTLGQYDAFLKNIGGRSMVGGRHLVDERVKGRFFLPPLRPFPQARVEVIEGDMVEVAPSRAMDVAYYDPPYNHRQYCDNYHVLENLARWEKPALRGKTRKFDRTGLQSPFSRRLGAAEALERLVRGTRARHIFLSYSSEGILTQQEIVGILSSRGRTTTVQVPYPVFGNGAGVSARRSVLEHLFHVQVEGTEP
jgi:adenine-specific DNA-methyltransferase